MWHCPAASQTGVETAGFPFFDSLENGTAVSAIAIPDANPDVTRTAKVTAVALRRKAGFDTVSL